MYKRFGRLLVDGIELNIVLKSHYIHQHRTRFSSLRRANDSGCFKLIHDAAGASEAYGKLALQIGCGARLCSTTIMPASLNIGSRSPSCAPVRAGPSAVGGTNSGNW